MEYMLEHEIRMKELKSTLLNHARNIKNEMSFEEDLKSNQQIFERSMERMHPRMEMFQYAPHNNSGGKTTREPTSGKSPKFIKRQGSLKKSKTPGRAIKFQMEPRSGLIANAITSQQHFMTFDLDSSDFSNRVT